MFDRDHGGSVGVTLNIDSSITTSPRSLKPSICFFNSFPWGRGTVRVLFTFRNAPLVWGPAGAPQRPQQGRVRSPAPTGQIDLGMPPNPAIVRFLAYSAEGLSAPLALAGLARFPPAAVEHGPAPAWVPRLETGVAAAALRLLLRVGPSIGPLPASDLLDLRPPLPGLVGRSESRWW